MSPCVLVTSRSVHRDATDDTSSALPSQDIPQNPQLAHSTEQVNPPQNLEHSPENVIPPETPECSPEKLIPPHNPEQVISPRNPELTHSPEQVISVRITSSVNVGRGRGKHKVYKPRNGNASTTKITTPVTQKTTSISTTQQTTESETITQRTDPIPVGANLEFIKQLNSKKEARGLSNFERIHSFPSYFENDNENEAGDSIAEASMKSTFELNDKDDVDDEDIADVPLARSVQQSPSQNYIHGLSNPIIQRNNKLTTVSFNIVHDAPKVTTNYGPSEAYVSQTPEPPKDQSDYHRPAEIYSEPSKIYGEPSKIYSEPSKIYSEPAKVYGEPAKVYGEPSKIYGEPSKFYSQPASLHLPEPKPEPLPKFTSWQHFSHDAMGSSTTISTTPMTVTMSSSIGTRKPDKDHQPEKNYEVDEKISVLTDGRSHGVQESSTERCKQENCKVGYVVEGRQYRKYRVEEKTSDGFIVGEYGVVRNEDGALRGVRYTADSDASPRLIYDALMKFLQLK